MDLQLELVFGPFYLYLIIYGAILLSIILGAIYFRKKGKRAEKRGWEEGKREAERLKRMELRRLSNKQNTLTPTSVDETGREVLNIRGRYDDPPNT